MELNKLPVKLQEIIHKYKYAILVLLIGLVLMIIPFGSSKSTSTPPAQQETVNKISEIPLEEKLSKLLSNVEGAGKVEVMLTVATGEEVIYQINENKAVSDNSNSENSSTVTITNSDRNEEGLVKQINPKTYLGAIIVCQGANNPTVRLQIVDAVSRVTGLGANCISILKMK